MARPGKFWLFHPHPLGAHLLVVLVKVSLDFAPFLLDAQAFFGELGFVVPGERDYGEGGFGFFGAEADEDGAGVAHVGAEELICR